MPAMSALVMVEKSVMAWVSAKAPVAPMLRARALAVSSFIFVFLFIIRCCLTNGPVQPKFLYSLAERGLDAQAASPRPLSSAATSGVEPLNRS